MSLTKHWSEQLADEWLGSRPCRLGMKAEEDPACAVMELVRLLYALEVGEGTDEEAVMFALRRTDERWHPLIAYAASKEGSGCGLRHLSGSDGRDWSAEAREFARAAALSLRLFH